MRKEQSITEPASGTLLNNIWTETLVSACRNRRRLEESGGSKWKQMAVLPCTSKEGYFRKVKQSSDKEW